MFTDEALRVDQSKVEATMKMLIPTRVTTLKGIIGMVSYLAMFLPHTSKVCEPLRQLEHKDVEWCWLKQHEDAINKIRELTTATPMFAYYDVSQVVRKWAGLSTNARWHASVLRLTNTHQYRA